LWKIKERLCENAERREEEKDEEVILYICE
jgi:hypothetical protein